MTILTQDIVRAGTGSTPGRADMWLPHLQSACARFNINTPARLAAFLAQIGHESARMAFTREIWGPTPAQSRYEGRRDLGNTQPGDGKRYMGRGLIQTTGRANYLLTREGLRKLGIPAPDFITSPETLEQPTWAALSAAWYWQSRGLNELADAGDFERITRRINGGLNGYEDRKALWAAAKKAMGV